MHIKKFKENSWSNEAELITGKFTEEDKNLLLESVVINDEILPYRLERLAHSIIFEMECGWNSKSLIRLATPEEYDIEIKLFKELEQESKGAWELLKYLAYLDPNQIETTTLSEKTGESN